ncbi:uncharacterized protein LOC112001804 [Quercus suber]|uniref:uncharacterized protein LOC112001804 n=1 Tax=Quercus suber TaxID=58331 RepID=UPI000CE28469|nr:uncharacterized protein LOC112001804 [Quercus suber]
MSVSHVSTDVNQGLKRLKMDFPLILGFSDEDKIGIIQSYDDALVIILRIGGYDVKRVLVVVPKGQIRLPVQTGLEVVEVDFIFVDAYSPYTAIVAKPWLHTLGPVSSTLHQKVKYPYEGRVSEILGDQSIAKQCQVAAIQHKPEAESSTQAEKKL